MRNVTRKVLGEKKFCVLKRSSYHGVDRTAGKRLGCDQCRKAGCFEKLALLSVCKSGNVFFEIELLTQKVYLFTEILPSLLVPVVKFVQKAKFGKRGFDYPRERMLRNIDPFGSPAIVVNVGKTSNELAVLY